MDQITNKISRVILDNIKKSPPNTDGDYLIGVNMYPSDNLLLVLLAIWKAGGAYLPLNHTFPQTRIDHILNESKPALVVYDEGTCVFLKNINK